MIRGILRDMLRGRLIKFLVCSLIAVSVFFTVTPNAQASGLLRLPNNLGLVGYWSMEDGAGTEATDFSGNGHEGALTNGPVFASGKIGQALSFDGSDDYANVGDVLEGLSAITVSAWVKATGYSTYESIVDKFWDGTDRGYKLEYSADSGKFGFNVNTDTHNDNSGNVASTFAPVANTWYHLVGTWDSSGSAVKLYVNGALDNSGSVSGSSTRVNASPLRIGNSYYNNTNQFNFPGLIDDVRIYNRALGATEVAALYRGSLGAKINASQNTRGPQSGLIGEWSFDGADATGTLALDRSGNGNSATLTNGATFTRGKFGQAIQFASASGQYAVTGNAAVLRPTTAVTLSTWIKTTTDGKDVAGSGIHGYGLQISAGQIYWYTYGNTNGYMHLAASTLTNGNWHHIVGTWDGSGPTSVIYVDGVDISATLGGTLPTSLDYTQSAFYIGDDPGGGGGTFNGLIDEVRVYNRALSAAEVAQLYNLGGVTVNKSSAAGPASSGLVLWHTFDGPKLNSTTSTDSSSSGYNGTLSNGPVPVRGKIGQALSFDGTDDYVKTTPVTIGSSIASVAFWLNWNAYANDDDFAMELGPSATGNDKTFYIDPNGATAAGRVELTIQDSGGGAGTSYLVKSFTRPSAGQWHHWVIILDNSTVAGDITAYIDGVAQSMTADMSTKAGSGNFKVDNLNFMSRNGSAVFGAGSLDDVRIYNRALSATEILQLYNQGK